MSKGQLKGPRSDWAKWRAARDKKLANPTRNAGAKRMRELAKKRAEAEAKEPT